MKGIIEHLIKQYITWRFRKRSPFLIALSASAAIVVACIGLGSLTGALSFRDVTLELSQGDSILFTILNATCVIALFVFIVSFLILVFEFFYGIVKSGNRKVLVVEGRGLRDDDGKALADSLSGDLPRSRVPYILDLRQHLDGKILEPELLAKRVSAAKDFVVQTRRGNGRSDTEVVYGGLTAVPLTVLTGVELDDEGKITVFDWDRDVEDWRPLDDIDDGLRFSEPELEDTPETESVLLAVSVSYPIDDTDLATSFDIPIVRMQLEGMSSSSHWSGTKQAALAGQFLEMAKKLSSKGVRHIHLVLAAPNSIAFNFGRRYDKRNLPDLTVYQYERSRAKKYPWGIRMPVGTKSEPSIERTDQSTAN